MCKNSMEEVELGEEEIDLRSRHSLRSHVFKTGILEGDSYTVIGVPED